MRYALMFALLLLAPGCDRIRQAVSPAAEPVPAAVPNAAPAPVPAAPRPPAAARTAEEFDTTSAEDRAAAAAAPDTAGEERLGTTIASLGSPTEPGFWLETPLVSAVRQGRAELAGGGASVNVELRPSGGAAGSGSQISLAAMRVLDVPLTDLPELVVFAE
ncbi:D-galactarate dehydratase [Aestuariibius sp. 2305UL40-4]|uniref:D-galactarate dehydratase n=1 Tax=Aestuariibius violaceus TaxID=3234132 RepID=UPI00345E3FF2